MSKKIIIFLSGAWQKKFNALLSEGDILLYSAGLSPPTNWPNTFELPRSDSENDRLLADWLVNHIDGDRHATATSLAECFLNDYFSYTIRPVAAAIASIARLISSSEIKELVLIAASSKSFILPMLGFSTTESTRGSPNLLMSRLANLLPKIFPRLNVSFYYTKGDALCVEVFRKLVLSLANIFFFLKYVFKSSVLFFAIRSQKRHNVSNMILVRTEHQARFAKVLMRSYDAASLIVLPQASQGSFRDFRKLVFSFNAGVDIIRPKLTMYVRALFDTLFDVSRLFLYQRRMMAADFRGQGFILPINFADMVGDIILSCVTIYYKNILSQILSFYKPDQLINFEMVGRMAGLEALAARQSQIKISTVQTALISSVPHPIFPYSDKFFVDSLSTLNMIVQNGSKSKGVVRYAGPPYQINTVRVPIKITRVVFFTQPYEVSVTNAILSTLCKWAIENSAVVTLRLHPRDIASNYEELFSTFSTVLMKSAQNGIESIICAHDTCITRTSSVAKESIALGTPVLLCLISNFDKSIKADYVDVNSTPSICAYSLDDIESLLCDRMRLCAGTISLAKRIFGDSQLIDIQKELLL